MEDSLAKLKAKMAKLEAKLKTELACLVTPNIIYNMIGRHGKTALKICGTAAVVATAWIYGGLQIHNWTMDAANQKERELAADVHWDTKNNPLYAFDTKHANNKDWTPERLEKFKETGSVQ